MLIHSQSFLGGCKFSKSSLNYYPHPRVHAAKHFPPVLMSLSVQACYYRADHKMQCTTNIAAAGSKQTVTNMESSGPAYLLWFSLL